MLCCEIMKALLENKLSGQRINASLTAMPKFVARQRNTYNIEYMAKRIFCTRILAQISTFSTRKIWCIIQTLQWGVKAINKTKVINIYKQQPRFALQINTILTERINQVQTCNNQSRNLLSFTIRPRLLSLTFKIQLIATVTTFSMAKHLSFEL